MIILGISAFYHDSAACLISDGDIVAAAQEERFTRIKHDPAFPQNAIMFCLKKANIDISQVDYISFYDKPFLKFERILETYLAYAPKGLASFIKAMPPWIKQKLWIKSYIKETLNFEGDVFFPEHHQSHGASAFYPSPFNEAAFLTIDGVGEWATTTYGVGKGNELNMLSELNFPHSLGLLYSAFTYYTGFKVNSGEYKVMGLAPYGEPKYKDIIYDNLIDVKGDGSFRLNMEYFDFPAGLTMTNKKFNKLFDSPPRKSETEITQREMDLARSVQEVTEEIVLKIAKHVRSETGMKKLCLAGGVALNCVANGVLHKENLFDDIWVQPASGDAGGALGSALYCYYALLGNNRNDIAKMDRQKGSYLGPKYSEKEVKNYLDDVGAEYEVSLNEDDMFSKVSSLLDNQKVVGWFQGSMEYGPRSLGARSIIGDPRSSTMQETMNLKIKFRESFRPFAPAVLSEKVSDYFDFEGESPYMLMVAPIKESRRKKMSSDDEQLFGVEKLNVSRSDLPAITHVDYSARLQTVHEETNEKFYKLLKSFDELTGCPVLINTSFNVRGEPIVCTPQDAYRCFMRTHMDYLVIGNIVIDKSKQAPLSDDTNWQDEFELD